VRSDARYAGGVGDGRSEAEILGGVLVAGFEVDPAAIRVETDSTNCGANAAAFGEVVVLATHHSAVFDAIALAGGADAFAGKTVIDINNPVSTETFTTMRPDGRSLTQAIADALPGASVGKAFNMAQARVWADPDKTFDGRQMVTLYTADADADATIADLIAQVGAAPVRLGGNDHAYQLEAAAAIVIRFLFAGGDAHTILNLIRPETKPIR